MGSRINEGQERGLNSGLYSWRHVGPLVVVTTIALFLLCCSSREDRVIRLDLEENGGLILPEGFVATAVVNALEGTIRHIAVNENGDVYAKLRYHGPDAGNVVLRDTNGDSRADIIRKFGAYPFDGPFGTGMRIHQGYLYFSSQTKVYRQQLTPGKMVPESEIEVIVIDDNVPSRREHIGKPLAFDDAGNLYVPFGGPSNACQDPKRTPGAPGLDPCPQLANYGGVWRFDAYRKGQKQDDGCLFSSGIRSLVGMEWNPADRNLYAVMHGRDDLLRMFANHFDPWESAMLPSEEFLKITEGSHFGWPYCFFDQITGQKVLNPEYGGDGTLIGRCQEYDLPIMGFPGHWAPNDILFYRGEQFPERYRDGAFVAFHGSTNRAPYPQSGYIVGFIPFRDGAPTGNWEIFADGFARVDTIYSVKDAVFRPMGLAVGPDGSLYVGDTEKGAIWRIRFAGDKNQFGAPQLANMEKRKNLNHIRTPDRVADNLQKDTDDPGELTYLYYCGACHQKNGKGDGSRFPPLAATDWVTGDKERLIKVVLKGLEGEIQVNGRSYNGVMPQHDFLSDQEVADVLTYIRRNFGNRASSIGEEEVRTLRNEEKLPAQR